MEKSDLLKLAIDDSRVRVKAWHDLILFVDKQATDLLRLYVTLAAAAVPVATAAYVDVRYGQPVAAGLAAIAFTLAAGVLCCFYAIDSPDIELPGRDGDFWDWARTSDVDTDELITAYVLEADKSAKKSQRANHKQAVAYRIARWLGLAAPLIGVGTAYLMIFVS